MCITLYVNIVEFTGDAGLDPTDIAVLDALVTGGAVLSLKAHYIQTLPDISPIISSLRYLNLSFNNFTVRYFQVSKHPVFSLYG